MRIIKHIVLHCTATPATSTVESIQNFWQNTLGWKNPGYHKIIKADGTIVELLSESQIANGVKGHNANSLHVSYIGGQNGKDTRTNPQKKALKKVVKDWHAKYPEADILGHRDLSPDINGDGIIEPWEWTKECPSFDVKEWLQTINL